MPAPLLANAGLAVAYLLVAQLGPLLSLPPGYAPPLFLPAGLALAALASAGAALLPGLALGALLLNLTGASVAPPGTGLPGALCTCAGALLQAGVGALLLRRWIDPALAAGRHVLRFLLLAPLICCLGVSVTLAALALVGAITPYGQASNWLARWAGDTFGVLLAAPLTWIAIAGPGTLWRRRMRLVGVPLLLSCGAFIAIYLHASRWEEGQQMQTFRLKAQQAGDALQARLSEQERFMLLMGRALNDPALPLSAATFANLAHGYLDQRPELLSMAWLMPVTEASRAGFEAWARRQGLQDFTIRSVTPGMHLQRASPRPEYMVATFVEPAASRILQGIDFLSEPQRAAVLAQALQSRRPSASAATPLFTSHDRPATRPGIILLQAVYPEQGNTVIGVLMLSLHVDSYLQRTLTLADFPDLLIRFDDVSIATRPQTLFRVGAAADADTAAALGRPLHFGGRDYLLTLAPSRDYLRLHRGWQSWTVLSGGLMLTALLGGLMLLVSGERDKIRAQVRHSTEQLLEREARLQAILDHAGDAILTAGADAVLLSVNPAAARLFGHAPQQMPGLALERLLPGATDLLASLGTGDGTLREHELDGIKSDGSTLALSLSVSRVDLPDERLFVCIVHDLSEQRRAQQDIHRLAHQDPLTGLANRFSLQQQLELMLAQARRNQDLLAVLFIDLDRFKKINDSHGHQTGDLLLVAVAERLRTLLRDTDAVARLGGDEFIVASGGHHAPEEAGHLAQRIVAALGAPYQLDAFTIHSGASIGISLFPDDGDDGATLLRHADLAMYAAKNGGRDNFQFFSRAMNVAAHERLQLENRLWQAFEQHEFELYLQPQVSLHSGRIIGAEALLRWHHPQLGLVGPERFIPIAEESNLILALGEWVLQRASELLLGWRQAGLGQLRLALNLSARQCHGGALLPQLDRLIGAGAIDAARLELEITETAAMQDPERSRVLLRQLRQRGVQVAIDDFGTGYSSLSYLKLFEIDRIKIDRGFVKDIESDPNDAVIVAATIGLAHALGLAVVAEGVETRAQCAFLRTKLCDEAQGYLFARPMTASAFLHQVQHQNGGTEAPR